MTDPTRQLEIARAAQHDWGRLAPTARAEALRPLAAAIGERLDDIADLIAEENGKPRAEAIAHEVLAAVQLVRFNCSQAAGVLRERRVLLPLQPHRSVRVARRPFGAVLAIAPWNLPFIIPLSQVLPALVAGNAVVLKPSELTPRAGNLIGELINSCEVPAGLFQVVQGDGSTAAGLIDARPDKVLFTGSVATGRRAMAACAEFPIPVSLELGGIDAMIVRADADIEFASSAATWGATFNGGQACCSIERLLVHRSLHDRFVARVADKMARVDRLRELGPAIDDRQLAVWRRHLDDANERNTEGVTVAAGGEFLADRRLEPTILTGPGVRDTLAWNEETFGPVVAAVPFDDDDEAVALHNATRFGLTASIFTADPAAARSMAARLRAGVVSINDIAATCYGSPELPWGGVGESGFGRTHGAEGLLDTTWAQVVDSPRMSVNTKRPWWYPYGRDLEETMASLTRSLADGGTGGARKLGRIARAGAGFVPLLSRSPRR